MASYRLLIKASAARELELLPRKDMARVARRIQDLAAEPRPQGNDKLAGLELFRIRQVNYRLLYTISDPRKTVTIIKIGHRRDVYR